jgi:predicted ABC-type ATPase
MSGSRPLLWVVVGPNGAGKSTYHRTRIAPHLNVPFVNADIIAAEQWPDAPEAHSEDAARAADARRASLLSARASFVTETVFSHPSRLELLAKARQLDYELWVTFVNVDTEALAVLRVADRVSARGHDIPTKKIRARYKRLVPLAVQAVLTADRGFVVDNSRTDRPLRDVLGLERGTVTYVAADLPAWAARAFAGVIVAERRDR